MAGSVQGTSASDMTAINQQIQDFKDGKAKITKSDLTKIVSSELAQGQQPSAEMIDLIDSYDKIDKNGDGIDYNEYKTYKNSPAGILSSLGLSMNSFQQQTSLLDFMGGSSSDAGSDDLLGNSSGSGNLMSNLLLNNSTSTSNSTESYVNKLLAGYSSADGENPESLINYLS